MEKEFRRFFAIEPWKKFYFAIQRLELAKNNLTGQILLILALPHHFPSLMYLGTTLSHLLQTNNHKIKNLGLKNCTNSIQCLPKNSTAILYKLYKFNPINNKLQTNNQKIYNLGLKNETRGETPLQQNPILCNLI
jgi:hypothetical protein